MSAFSSAKSGFRSLLRRKNPSGEEDITPTDTMSLCNAVYYPSWRVYCQQPPSSMNLKYVTHIFYAFARAKEDGTVCYSDEWADTQIDINGLKGCLSDLKSVKGQYPHIKTLLSIGGGGEGSANLSAVAANSDSRARFAWTAEEMTETHGLDGIDVDWEHPSSSQQGEDYVQLLATLRQALPAPRYLLTSALPAGEWVLRNINLGVAIQHLDYINLMTYDFAGPWTSECGHHAQLYTPKHPHNDASRVSCSSGVAYVQSRGVPTNKILLGIPTYGRSFRGASKVGDTFKGQGGDEGTFEYRELPRPGSVVKFDDKVGAAFCLGGDGGFVSYDTPKSVAMKADFARQQKLGGLFYWTGTGDTNDAESLVETGWRSLRG